MPLWVLRLKHNLDSKFLYFCVNIIKCITYSKVTRSNIVTYIVTFFLFVKLFEVRLDLNNLQT